MLDHIEWLKEWEKWRSRDLVIAFEVAVTGLLNELKELGFKREGLAYLATHLQRELDNEPRIQALDGIMRAVIVVLQGDSEGINRKSYIQSNLQDGILALDVELDPSGSWGIGRPKRTE